MTHAKAQRGTVGPAMLSAALMAMTAGAAIAQDGPLQQGPLVFPTTPTEPETASGALTWDSPKTHQFGRIYDDGQHYHMFRFTNSGDAPLRILEARGSCGCTVPQVPDRVFQPGESGELRVIFDPANRAGDQKKRIDIKTDSESVPNDVLFIEAKVMPLTRLSPVSGAQFGQLEKGASKTVRLKLSGLGENFAVSAASVQETEFVTVEIEDSRTTELLGEAYTESTLAVTILPGAPVGPFRGDVVLNTSLPERSQVRVPFVSNIRGELSARPLRVSLGRVTPDQEIEQEFTVQSRLSTPFEIERVEVRGTLGPVSPEFSIEPVDESKRDAYRVTLTGTGDSSTSRYMGTLVVHTNLPDEPTLEIRYFGFNPEASASGAAGGVGRLP